MNIEIAFPFSSTVRIKEIDQIATVRCISVDSEGITYTVAYWLECKYEKVNLTPNELEAVTK